jgi:hypothetical protein
MMKGIKKVLILVIFGFMIFSAGPVKAQCAMCTTAVESNNKSGSTTTRGLNNGIIYLLAAPYLAVVAVGLIWYKKYRRKNVNIHMRNEKLNLN